MKQNLIVAIQGIEGSYHDIVAQEYFGNTIQIIHCDTFDDVVHQIKSQKCTHGLMAIENSIAGSILPNYSLIDCEQMTIVGEHLYSISHHLMALPSQTIDQIEEVHSHPMALMQCKQFFQQYPHIRLIESYDTAEEAKWIAQKKIKGYGAIASQQAASLFGLDILASDIQTIKNNVTRFVMIQRTQDALIPENLNKASLKFTLDHQRGSLATVLNLMSDCQLNLTKIQSLPVIETPGKYAFFVDVLFNDYKQFEKAKKVIEIIATQFKVLGVYQNKKYD
ncbi:MAG: prephenate dehydratase [Flavobacteriaceae bacterium]|nr:prephenate dehydratase [Flavobacteriaceae bacterium]MCY4267505.1 prephenate dehydratase [Flavobacteriaceae bacterium]MCY4298043.1 prephenate dehydratase [Flavobacteriaceae bacterium]